MNSKTKRISLMLGVSLVLIVPLIIIYPLLRDYVSNTWRLQQFTAEFQRIEHPPETKSVKLKTNIENPSNGNQCVYTVAELRKYTGGKDEITKFYQGKTVRHPLDGSGEGKGDSADRHEVLVTFVNSEQAVKSWGLSPEEAAGNLYVLSVEGWFRPNSDLRCH